MKYDHKWFLSRIKECRPNDYLEYEFLEEYKKATVRINALHKPCGKVVPILPNSFISRGSGCHACAVKNRGIRSRKSHEEVIRDFPSTVTALTKYKGAFEEMKVHCSRCNKTYDVIPRELISSGCTRCSRTYKRNLKDIVEEVENDTNGEYTVVSDTYKNAHEKVQIRHNICKKVYPATIHNFRMGRRCPYCVMSRGEETISQVLDSLNVPYECQKKFPILRMKKSLSYDFFIPESHLLIEYQGEQHYKPVKLFGGEYNFKVQKERDKLKREFSQEMGFRLLEIPYTSRSFEEIKTTILNALL